MKKVILSASFSISLFLLVFTGIAQSKKTSSDLSSPNSALYNYLSNLQGGNYRPEIASDIFQMTDRTRAQALSIKLKQILDGKGIYIELNEVPKDKNYIDSLSHKARYVLSDEYPEIFLLNSDNQWVFSETAIKAIPKIHKRIFPLGTDRLLNLLPKAGTNKIFGLYLWQHFGLLFLLFIGFIVHKILTYFFRQILGNAFKKNEKLSILKEHVFPVARPLSLVLIAFIFTALIPILQLPASISYYIMMFIKVLVVILCIRVIFRLIDFFSRYMAKLASKTESTLDDQLIPLVRKTLKTFVFILGSLIALDTLKIPIMPLLTGLSIGGLAFALAAQDTIKNFFGSLMIFIDRPFQVGDWITSGGIDGTVEEVGLRATRIRTFRNSLVYVPNGKLADTDIDNHGLRTYRRYSTKIGITYDTPPAKINAFVEGLKGIVNKHPHTNKNNYHIYLNEFGGSSLNIMFYVFFKVPDWGDELKTKHELMVQIIQLAETLNVRFAFPSQTLYVEEIPGQQSLTPGHGESDEMLKQKVDGFLGKL